MYSEIANLYLYFLVALIIYFLNVWVYFKIKIIIILFLLLCF